MGSRCRLNLFSVTRDLIRSAPVHCVQSFLIFVFTHTIIIMFDNMLADETDVIPHSNVVMATLGYVKDFTRDFTFKPCELCTMNLEVYIPGIHHARDDIFFLNLTLLHGLRMATALERLEEH